MFQFIKNLFFDESDEDLAQRVILVGSTYRRKKTTERITVFVKKPLMIKLQLLNGGGGVIIAAWREGRLRK